MSVWAVIVAAGSGERMGLGCNKALLPLGGKTVLERSVEAFEGMVDGIVAVCRRQDEEQVRALGINGKIVTGGPSRQESVLNGLRVLPQSAQVVLVHDAARPFVSRETIERCIASAQEFGSGVAAVPVTDTIKRADAHGVVEKTLPRQMLFAAQTPQAFRPQELTRALEMLTAHGEHVTDDAAAMELCGYCVRLVKGDEGNNKLTHLSDLQNARARLGEGEAKMECRIGHGFDVHRLQEGRKLILCGVEIPYEKGLLGHSDADVAVHALMDALLGALALGDIGKLFPDTDARYSGISSILLLKEVAALLARHGAQVENADITIIAQRPKLKPYEEEMVSRVAAALGIETARVSVKATTTEGLGFEGEGLGISAHAVALVRKP